MKIDRRTIVVQVMLRAARCNGPITDFDYAGSFHMEVVKM